MDASKIPAGITDLPLREQAADLWDAYLAAEDALENAPEDADLTSMDAARDAASDAYDALVSPSLAISYYKYAEKYRCVVCGIPVWDTDEFLEDPETGDLVLRAAIGLAPRPVDEDDAEESEAA